VSEREAERAVVIGRSQDMIAAQHHLGTDCRPISRWQNDSVMVPGKEHSVEKNGKDREKSSRPPGRPMRPCDFDSRR
jgi:hypothetical protein